MSDTRTSGRRADAARNDERILDAAREVFAEEGYRARMAGVAQRAGVGVGTLYERYPSKDILIARMNIAGMRRIITEAEDALAADTDAWTAFATFMHNCVEAGAGALLGLAGLVPPTPEQRETIDRLHETIERLVARTTDAKALRPGISAADVYLLFAQLRAEASDDPQRARELRGRYLALILDGLRSTTREPLPGPPADWRELRQRWTRENEARGDRTRGRVSGPERR